MGEKVEQDAAATIRSLAARNGRDAKLAESAVLESRSFTADEALQGQLIDLVAPSLADLLRQLQGRTVQRGAATVTLATAGAPLREVEMSTLRAFLAHLIHPNVAYVLLTLGTLGLFFELSNPGAVLPGVVGAICLVLAFYALSVLPVNVAGLALLCLALLFFIAEVKVTSYGLLTVAGLVSRVLGSLLLFKRSEPAMRVSLALIGSLTAFTALVVGFLLWMVLRARRNPVRTGLTGLLQEAGTARTALDPQGPRGKVFVHGEIWDAVAAEPVAAGETVEVIAIENFTLTVRPRRTSPAAL
jgi:membrane-bound serine protease (ClpP class)